jgi:excinuclease ABC subunit C
LFDFQSFLKNFTTAPGIYRMYDSSGHVIYVGKAKNLKKRLSQYFQDQRLDLKTQALVRHIHRIETTVVHSETDALILENNEIKQYQPKYNVLLRDDKSYPYIFLSGHKHPRLAFHRGAQREKGKYFGPYPNRSAVKESLNTLQKIFPIRQCEDSFYRSRTRPCLQYQIKRCLAPCVSGYVDDAIYQKQVQLVCSFLEGKNTQVMNFLVAEMTSASDNKAYEQAAKFRDQISALSKVMEQQEVSVAEGNMDVIGAAYDAGIACFHILFIRNGNILGSRNYFPKVPKHEALSDVLRAFVLQFYLNAALRKDNPTEVILSHKFSDLDVLEQTLQNQRQEKLKFKTNVRQHRKNFLQLAVTNAQHSVQNRLQSHQTNQERFFMLQDTLGLNQPIQRMECFDISHTQGEATVASCVVFLPDGPANQLYRRFNIKNIKPGDDYAAMRQVIYRRFNQTAEIPDVIFIDGGLGQLNCAEEVLAECLPQAELRPLMIGVAKGEGRKAGLEKLIFSGGHDVVHLSSDSPALHLVQHIRDESHRFAITGHRKQRDSVRSKSALESVPGVGSKRRQKILSYLGGMQEVKNASVSQLAKIPGISLELAQKIYDALRS